MLTRTRLPAVIPCQMYNLWLVPCLLMLNRDFSRSIFCLSSSVQLDPVKEQCAFNVEPTKNDQNKFGRNLSHFFSWQDLEFEVLKSSIWKHKTSCDKGGFFLSFLPRNLDDRLGSNFYMLRYTKWEDWSLAITNSFWSRSIVLILYKCIIYNKN